MLICHRRQFIQMGLGALAASMLPLKAVASIYTRLTGPCTLAFYNTHTHEQLEVCYRTGNAYCPDALAKINHILRDHRCDTVAPIDTHLLDLLYDVRCETETTEPFQVISGYRSPATNEMLRRNTRGVAKTSYHTKGQAIDIRIAGYSTKRLRNLCVKMRTGGVGYYARSNFVHLDIGPVRRW